MDELINTKKYWNKRFDLDWENNGGREQSEYFTKIAMKILPEAITNMLNNELSFLDWGCAEGDGTSIFASRFPLLKVSGLDFSSSAIRKAREHFPHISFHAGSLNDTGKKYDVIFTSNCLEHYQDPFEWIDHLMEFTQQALIIMVPFQEYNRIDEHFFTFDYSTFPLELNSFMLSYFRVVESDPQYWPGKQLLIIYSRHGSEITKKLKLDIYQLTQDKLLNEQDGYIDKLKNQINQRDEIILKISEENKTFNEWVAKLQYEVKVRDEATYFLNEEIKEKDIWITNLQNEVKLRDEATSFLKTEIEEKDKWIKILQKEVELRDEATAYLKKEIEKLNDNYRTT